MTPFCEVEIVFGQPPCYLSSVDIFVEVAKENYAIVNCLPLYELGEIRLVAMAMAMVMAVMTAVALAFLVVLVLAVVVMMAAGATAAVAQLHRQCLGQWQQWQW